MVLVVKKVNFVYFYKLLCPYCAMVNSYLIEPLEYLDIARIERVNIGAMYVHKYMAVNERISKLFGKAEPISPLLYDIDNDIAFIPVGGEDEPISVAISNMVFSVVEHICKHVIVYDDVRRKKRYLNPTDLRDPRLLSILKSRIIGGGAR